MRCQGGGIAVSEFTVSGLERKEPAGAGSLGGQCVWEGTLLATWDTQVCYKSEEGKEED